MMNNGVYVIIVTYNAMKWVDRCLSSLRQSEVPCVPVIIDNLSKDETANYIREHYPEAHLIINKKNRGFGQANNQGIEWAYKQGGSHFFLLNQDAWVHPDTIGKLVEVQDKYNIAIASPIHLNGPGVQMDIRFFSKIVFDEKNVEYVSDLELGTIKPYYKVYKVNAAAWMLSRDTVETIGGFDPIYFHYGEDGNYCQRIKYHKKHVAFVPSSYIHHDRVLQGNMKVYKQNEVLMCLLYAYSDVNSGLFENIQNKAILHLWLLKTAIVSLFTFHFVEFWNVIHGYLSFFGRIPMIPKSKTTNRTIGPSWLNLSK